MAIYGDHLGASDDAYRAARALAHATIRLDHPEDPFDVQRQRPEYPEDTYSVIGNVLAVLRCLHQVVQQVDACQHRAAARATGRDLTAAAHGHLRDAVFALDRAHAHLDLALGVTSAITWQPAPTPQQPAAAVRADADVAPAASSGVTRGGASGLGL
ncbi:hypothetical protein [Myceligenerans crystallogenes]|uniref:Uncharacterized protein n=1 Tax=Myceligenerans crystallogenes TaxID=316335 RepID=A0ABP4ZVP3_9MICO